MSHDKPVFQFQNGDRLVTFTEEDMAVLRDCVSKKNGAVLLFSAISGISSAYFYPITSISLRQTIKKRSIIGVVSFFIGNLFGKIASSLTCGEELKRIVMMKNEGLRPEVQQDNMYGTRSFSSASESSDFRPSIDTDISSPINFGSDFGFKSETLVIDEEDTDQKKTQTTYDELRKINREKYMQSINSGKANVNRDGRSTAFYNSGSLHSPQEPKKPTNLYGDVLE